MSLSDWANIAIIVQGVVIIVSLGFVLYQLRENARLTRAANTQKLVELTSPFTLQLMQDRGTAELWVQGAQKYDTMDSVDKERYSNLVSWWLIFYANIYYQQRQKLLDEEIYAPWSHDLEYFIATQNLEQLWGELKEFFQPIFVEHVDRLIAAHTKKTSSQ
jgi:hypothetical protein